MNYLDIKKNSSKIANSSIEMRNNGLKNIIENLEKNRKIIITENQKDIQLAEKDKLSKPIIKRLLFDNNKIDDVIKGLKGLIELKDPLFKKSLDRNLDDDLILERISCPIGIIGVIFESRPDALIQISSLCIKSGNSVILKGGSEGNNTNSILFDIVRKSVIEAGLPDTAVNLIKTRENVRDMLKEDKNIDLIIPRGSNEFVKYIMNNSNIPVMGHADGICHVYIDKDADIEKAIKIINDSKTQYVAACNTLETTLIHEDIAEELLKKLNDIFKDRVKIYGCNKTKEIIDCNKAENENYSTEYLDYTINVKIVKDINEAISHIAEYGSKHTDAIVTENKDTADTFLKTVDSASVYHNCSTRFADGFRYGFGAEVGISTGKLHARGPVGLEGLITYKYLLRGNGNIVDDYATGRKEFKFKDRL